MDSRKLDRLTALADEIGSVEGALDRLSEQLRAQGSDPALAREAQRARGVLRRRVRELRASLLDEQRAVRVSVLVFDVQGDLFAIASAAVGAVRALASVDAERVDGREVVRVDGSAVPLRRLGEMLGLSSEMSSGLDPAMGTARGATHALVIEGAGGRVALVVDRVHGREDLVVRALGPSLRGVPLLAGAADLGDERIALVVDAAGPFDGTPGAVAERARRAERSPSAERPRAPEIAPPAVGPALVVETGRVRYALSLPGVRQVVASARVRPVPRAPVGIVGVIARHGAVTTVIDLAWLAGVDAAVSSERGPIVLVDLDDEVVGLRVERVVGVVREFGAEGSPPVVIDPARRFAERRGQAG